MLTISEAIKIQLAKMPFVSELLSEDMVNIMSLARKLEPDLEEMCMKEMTIEAIAMSLRRTDLTGKSTVNLKTIFSTTPDIMVRSHLCEFTIKKDGNNPVVEKIIKALSLSKENFFTVTQGVFEDTIIVSDTFENLVRSFLQMHQIIAFFGNLSAITVRLPPENIEISGIYYQVLKSLAMKGINVIEAVSTFREYTIIVREKDVEEAFVQIKKLF